MKKHRICFKSVMTICLLCLLTLGAFADEAADDFPVIELPEDFSFTQSESCSEHKYFHQATACDNGTFIICSHHIDDHKPTDKTFHTQYIDYYNADGSFAREYSFWTSQAYVAELTPMSINLYFYAYTITISLDTGELVCYDTPDCYVANNGELAHLQRADFTSGAWNYSCKKSFEGYTALCRENGAETQQVVTMTGTGLSLFVCLVGMIFVGGLSVLLFITLKKKQKS